MDMQSIRVSRNEFPNDNMIWSINSVSPDWSNLCLVTAASNPTEFFGHLLRYSKLCNQIVTLKDVNGEPITEPASQAEAFADRYREIHRRDTEKPTPYIHREAISMTPLLIEATVVQHAFISRNPHKGQGRDSLYPVVLKAIHP